jgi:DNA-binding transcriptional MerR regulator
VRESFSLTGQFAAVTRSSAGVRISCSAYAGVTVRAVRHYHKIGLLPEPERDRSGYRIYDAASVVRLIRIHILADAGVPLARVQELLDAGPQEFADGVHKIDKDLRAEVRRLQGTRKRLAGLAAGEHLALPQSGVDYLDRLRGLGVEERYIEMERDAWIMIAAQVPHLIDAVIAEKHEQLDDPGMIKLYSLLRGPLDTLADDPRVVEIADILEPLAIRAVEAGEAGADGFDDQFVDLLDMTMVESAPGAERLPAILEERGWRGLDPRRASAYRQTRRGAWIHRLSDTRDVLCTASGSVRVARRRPRVLPDSSGQRAALPRCARFSRAWSPAHPPSGNPYRREHEYERKAPYCTRVRDTPTFEVLFTHPRVSRSASTTTSNIAPPTRNTDYSGN